uniref:Exonuclease domain-containing protein n=2 Tax=Pseudictyota dubia TaxID=2749911 RepID=A0A7R9ZA75_9STRA|mmetsp:Transcript_35943/g.66233  ORF Transcript_35943/g.66233 Transcript_35943/m.66233 type:complete len:355 (+) Transcript_35943:415-1479(+)
MAEDRSKGDPQGVSHLTTEQVQSIFESLVESAPPKVRGRRPTEAEIAAGRAHKAKVKSFLDSLPLEQRRLFTTSGIPVGKKGKEKRQKSKAQKSERKPAQALRPFTDSTDNIISCADVDYLCVLDFEATCNDRGPAPRPQEIIEFPTLLVNVRTGNIEGTFHYYIKPDVNPTLSAFCTSLTGITQRMVDHGISLESALALHQSWLDEKGIVPVCSVEKEGSDDKTSKTKEQVRPATFMYVTCGDWDLKTCLPNQLHYHGMSVPPCFHYWINIKFSFQRVYGKKSTGMVGMLNQLGLELKGRHHSGIDDCRNIARICAKMLKDGWMPGEKAAMKRLEKPRETRPRKMKHKLGDNV